MRVPSHPSRRKRLHRHAAYNARHQPAHRGSQAHSPARARRPWRLPILLTQPSPSVAGTYTTENLMVYWADWFGRFHREVPHYVPYELKTLDCPLFDAAGTLLLKHDGNPCLMRCIREIARKEHNGQVEWLLISWLVGLPGVTFKQCSSLADARREFDAAASPIQLPESLPPQTGFPTPFRSD